MIFLFLACTSSEVDKNKDRKQEVIVTTLSYPASYLVRRLAGDLVREECILPAGEDPVTWRPSASMIADVQRSDLIVANGAGFEGWVKTASLPTSKLILSADGLSLIHGVAKTHSHGKGGEHSHGEIDPHTWASPAMYKQQAKRVYTALQRELPSQGEQLEQNWNALQGELDALDQEYRLVFARFQGMPMAANHPSYTYLARDYSLSITAFDFDPEPDTQIDQKEYSTFEDWRGGVRSSVLLWESQPSALATAAFADGVQHVYIDPLEQPEGTYDYFSQAKANIQRFQSIQLNGSTQQ